MTDLYCMVRSNRNPYNHHWRSQIGSNTCRHGAKQIMSESRPVVSQPFCPFMGYVSTGMVYIYTLAYSTYYYYTQCSTSLDDVLDDKAPGCGGYTSRRVTTTLVAWELWWYTSRESRRVRPSAFRVGTILATAGTTRPSTVAITNDAGSRLKSGCGWTG